MAVFDDSSNPKGEWFDRTIDSALPKDLEAICLKAIAKQPDACYDNLNQLADDLDRWKLDMPKPAPRPPGAGQLGGMAGMPGGGRPPLSQGYGGTILQADGKLSFQVAGIHTAAKNLGQGTLEQYLDVDPRRGVKFNDTDLEIEIGHVYLLRSWNRGLGMASADRLQQHVIDSSDYALVRVLRQDCRSAYELASLSFSDRRRGSAQAFNDFKIRVPHRMSCAFE